MLSPVRKQQLVAALVLLHVVAIGIGAFPLLVDKRGMDWDKWQEPLVKNEFAAWSERLSITGIDITPEKLTRKAWHVSQAINDAVYAGRAPFEPYYEILGTRQRWRMFPAPEMDPFRFEIDILEPASDWKPLFVQHSKTANWRADWLEHDRFRAALNLYAWDVYPEGYDDLVSWIAEQVSAEFPDATQVRIRFRVLAGKPPEAMRIAPTLSGDTFRQQRIARLR